MPNAELFAILPYLPTSKSTTIRGITFHSSTDCDHLPTATARHLKTIFPMFRLANGQKPERMSYAHLPLTGDPAKDAALWLQLQQVHILIGYLCTSMTSYGERLRFYEFAYLYVFFPDPRHPVLVNAQPPFLNESVAGLQNRSWPVPLQIAPSSGPRHGYTGWVNFETEFRAGKQSCIHAPLVYFHGLGDHKLGNPDLSHIVKQSSEDRQAWALADLVRSSTGSLTSLEERVLTAFQWHNKSAVADIREEVALVHLAIAFECLFALPQDGGVTQRFVDALHTLVGPAPRLDSWALQFYNARSDVIHKGVSARLRFYATDKENVPHKGKSQHDPQTYLSRLTTYGWRIFPLCVNTMLAGASVADAAGLSVSLFHNQERLEELCTILRPTFGNAMERLTVAWPLVRQLHTVDMESIEQTKVETILAAGHALLKTYLDASLEPIDDFTNNLIDSIVAEDTSLQPADILAKYRELSHHLGSHRDWSEETYNVLPDPLSIIEFFADYAQWNGTILTK